jgi:hypothetical protein
MSLATIERQVWGQAKEVACNKKLRLKDILEWSTSEQVVRDNMQEGEVVFPVSDGIWVCIPREMDKRKPA